MPLHFFHLFILHIEYHVCWWPGDTRGQVISSRVIDLVISEYSSIRTRGVNSSPPDKMAAIMADDIFKCIFVNENNRITIQISLKFVPDSPIDNNAALV